jgi:hypothetical protein
MNDGKIIKYAVIFKEIIAIPSYCIGGQHIISNY